MRLAAPLSVLVTCAIARCTHERFVVGLAKSKQRLVRKRAGFEAKGTQVPAARKP